MGGDQCGRRISVRIDRFSTFAGYLGFREAPGHGLHSSARVDSEFLRWMLRGDVHHHDLVL